jgi:hypothetical protein
VLEMSPAASNAANFDLPIGLSHRPPTQSVLSSLHCLGMTPHGRVTWQATSTTRTARRTSTIKAAREQSWRADQQAIGR